MQSTVYSLQSQARVYERTGNGKRSSAQNGTVRSTAIRRHRSGDQRWNAHNTQIGKTQIDYFSRSFDSWAIPSIYIIFVFVFSKCCRRSRNRISMNGTSDSIRPYISRRMAVNVCHLKSSWSIDIIPKRPAHPNSLLFQEFPWRFQCFSSFSACSKYS